jgi:hypothetical protein
MKFAITKWSGGLGILVVEEYEPPRSSRSSVPPAVAACRAASKSLTREVERLLGGVKLPERRSL